jgi:hypothetical protein
MEVRCSGEREKGRSPPVPPSSPAIFAKMRGFELAVADLAE